jgi:hypothetical protein
MRNPIDSLPDTEDPKSSKDDIKLSNETGSSIFGTLNSTYMKALKIVSESVFDKTDSNLSHIFYYENEGKDKNSVINSTQNSILLEGSSQETDTTDGVPANPPVKVNYQRSDSRIYNEVKINVVANDVSPKNMTEDLYRNSESRDQTADQINFMDNVADAKDWVEL